MATGTSNAFDVDKVMKMLSPTGAIQAISDLDITFATDPQQGAYKYTKVQNNGLCVISVQGDVNGLGVGCGYTIVLNGFQIHWADTPTSSITTACFFVKKGDDIGMQFRHSGTVSMHAHLRSL